MTGSIVVNHATPLSLIDAPAFELALTPDQVSLSESGSAVILAVYPEDWSPVCSDEMAVYQELLPDSRGEPK